MLKCPCYNCVCVAICRLKLYSKLVNCQILSTYIIHCRVPVVSDDALWRVSIFKSLNPTSWSVNPDTGLFISYDWRSP